jgi:hypothetical protein
MDESFQLAHEVDALAAQVAELEAAVEERQRYRAALHEASVAVQNVRRHLPRDEGPLGGEAATEAWGVVVTVVGLVLVIGGAWGLDQKLGSAACLAAGGGLRLPPSLRCPRRGDGGGRWVEGHTTSGRWRGCFSRAGWR